MTVHMKRQANHLWDFSEDESTADEMAESARREVERCRVLADVLFTSPPPEKKQSFYWTHPKKRAEPLLGPPGHTPPPNLDDKPWHKYRQHAKGGGDWWTWECGIIDIDYFSGWSAESAQQSEGIKLRLAANMWVGSVRNAPAHSESASHRTLRIAGTCIRPAIGHRATSSNS